MNLNTKKIAATATIGAIYAALTMLLVPISYGTLQFRISEALCILPFFFPSSAIGLTIGCLIANLLSSAGILDVIFGSLATLLAGICTAAIGKAARKKAEARACEVSTPISMWTCVFACLMPVVFNAPIIGAILAYVFPLDTFWMGFLVFGAQVGIGELGVMLILGLPLMRYMLKNPYFKELFSKYL